MKINGNFSDTKLERLQSISINRVISPSDTVDLESHLKQSIWISGGSQIRFHSGVISGGFKAGGARGKTKKGTLWWRHHSQPTAISTLIKPKIRPPKDMFLRLRHDWHRRKCKRVFMKHNFDNTEKWEDKASNTQKMCNSKLASPPLFYFHAPFLCIHHQ